MRTSQFLLGIEAAETGREMPKGLCPEEKADWIDGYFYGEKKTHMEIEIIGFTVSEYRPDYKPGFWRRWFNV